MRDAGFAQKEAGTIKPEFGDPFGNPPYGYDLYDQECIKDGIDYFNKYRK